MATVAKKHEIDMQNGKMFGKILLFTLPILFSSILQLLFNAADLIVVGQFDSDLAVGAVGATTALINLILSLFLGLSVGAGVCVSVSIGAKREKDTSEFVHTAIATALAGGVLVAIVGIILAPQMLIWMNTDASILPLATTYLRIYFLAAPANLLYNFGFSIMRTVGDTRRPLLYLTASGCVNVLLNLLLVIVFHLGVAGVAIATAASLILSATLVTLSLIRYENSCRLIPKRIKFHRARLREILRLGVPAGIQSALFGISNTMLQASVNSLGPAATSGCAAASSLEGFCYVTINSFNQTITVFAGQNYGAGKYRRILRAMWLCLALGLLASVLLPVLLLLLKEPLLALYLPDAPLAVPYAVERMWSVMPYYFLITFMEVLTGCLRGINVSFPPMLVTLLGTCALRILWIKTIFPIPQYHTIKALFFSYPVSWGVTALFLGILLVYYYRHRCAPGPSTDNA